MSYPYAALYKNAQSVEERGIYWKSIPIGSKGFLIRGIRTDSVIII